MRLRASISALATGSCHYMKTLSPYMTTDGVLQPTRTTQGGCNSAANFQACVEPCFSKLRAHLLAWLDEFALYAADESRLFDVLEKFLQICEESNLKISITKSVFFVTTIKCCGRIIDADGVKSDPAKFQGLLEADLPHAAYELVEYVHCVAWMASCIPNFSERVASLRDIQDKAYDQSGKRTKKFVAKYTLSELG